MDSNSLYREEILEHYRSPQNFGRLEKFGLSSKQLNPFCGDEIEIFVQWARRAIGDTGDRRVVEEVGFVGVGCAISIAGASILTEHVKGKTKKELTKLSQNDMLTMLGITVSETRKKCALLALSTLQDCLK